MTQLDSTVLQAPSLSRCTSLIIRAAATLWLTGCYSDAAGQETKGSTAALSNASELTCTAAGSGSETPAQEATPAGRHCRHHGRCHCGDGVLQPGEQCDDGNHANGDGCDARCRHDDDTATPGDDRPGYMVCKAAGVCATLTECCIAGSGSTGQCQEAGSSCQGVWGQCDGPEDCADSEICWEARWPLCSTADNHDPRGARRCHHTEQCGADEICDDGYCHYPE